VPSYRRHKSTGQAVVTLSGRDFYLGPWNSAASKQQYRRLTSEWLAAGGILVSSSPNEITIAELLAAFWKHADTHYVDADGNPTSERATYKTLIARFRKAYGPTLAKEFGPLKLKAFRQMLVDAKLCRKSVNRTVCRVRSIFKWGAENELISPSLVAGLKCVAGLQYGKTEADETNPVRPVPNEFVDAVLPLVAPQVAAMIELQRVTGMRSGEVCRMRMADLNTSGKVWTYCPARHKTMHHGHSRTVYLGPRAQKILLPWIRTELEKFLFSPAEAELARRQSLHSARTTPLHYGNRPGSNLKSKPKKSAGAGYSTMSYLHAVKYGIEKCNRQRKAREEAEIPSWHPHQLRHNAATYFRKQHGLEVARVLLGHKHAAMTEVYAEADSERAVEVVAKIG
jgi:integrase